jgi:hypothetical protein
VTFNRNKGTSATTRLPAYVPVTVYKSDHKSELTRLIAFYVGWGVVSLALPQIKFQRKGSDDVGRRKSDGTVTPISRLTDDTLPAYEFSKFLDVVVIIQGELQVCTVAA